MSRRHSLRNAQIIALAYLLVCSVVNGENASAQLIPDSTLNTESSVVVPLNSLVEQIQGGAIRGGNLFHSFNEFNVGTGRSVYFANPAAVTNILTRVTGVNPSDIFGTLGVDGNANLVLINPNGINFGPDASLDLRGSFTATTADGIKLGEDAFFSATDTENSSLLSIQPEALFNNAVQNHQGNINQAGDLAVNPGENLTLLANWVKVTGSLTAPGGKVEVLGNAIALEENAHINVSSPSGGGTVLVGGEFQGKGDTPTATRTFVGKNVTIAANATANGDGDGGGGEVIVWADQLTAFYGEVSARGGTEGGDGGFVEISGKESLVYRGKVDTSSVTGSIGTLLLDPYDIVIKAGSADGDDNGYSHRSFGNNPNGDNGQVVAADATPTILYESELEWQAVYSDINLQANNDITIENLASNLDLSDFSGGTGSIMFTADADGDGNGDFIMEDTGDTIFTGTRDITISGANLTIGNINTGSFSSSGDAGDGAAIVLKASGNINVEGNLRSRSYGNNNAGKGGLIDLYAGGNIDVDGNLDSFSYAVSGDGKAGGLIDLEAKGNITVTGRLDSSSYGSNNAGQGGKIDLESDGSIEVTGNFNSYSSTPSGNAEAGGAITLDAGDSVTITGNINSRSRGSNNVGKGGDVDLSSDGSINLTGDIDSYSYSASGNGGEGGIVKLDSGDGITITGNLNSRSRGRTDSGNGGAVDLKADGNIEVTGNIDSLSFAFINDASEGGAITFDSGGNIEVTGNLNSRSDGGDDSGKGGNIDFDSDGSIEVTGNLSSNSYSYSENANEGGAISLDADDSITITGNLNSQSRGKNDAGKGGNVDLNSDDSINIDGDIDSFSYGVDGNGGEGGAITLSAGDDATISGNIDSRSRGENNAAKGGDVDLSSDGSINLTGNIDSFSYGVDGNGGEGGTVTLKAVDNATISGSIDSRSRGNKNSGNGGAIALDSDGNIEVTGTLDSSSFAFLGNGGEGGAITLYSGGDIQVDGDLDSSSYGDDNADKGGTIGLNADGSIEVTGDLDSSSYAFLGDASQGGAIILDADGNIQVDGNFDSSSVGDDDASQGGKVDFNSTNGSINFTGKLESFSVASLGNAGEGGAIKFASGSDIQIDGTLNSSSEGNSNTGKGGDIDLSAGNNLTLSSGFEIGTQGSLGGSINFNSGSNIKAFNGLAISSSDSQIPNTQGGDFVVTAKSLFIQESDFVMTTSGQANTGEFLVNTSDSFVIEDGNIANQVTASGSGGNALDVEINTAKLELLNGGRIASSTFGQGSTGLVKINATEFTRIIGEDSGGFVSGIFSQIEDTAKGNSGGIELTTGSLQIVGGGRIIASTFGEGDAGLVKVNVADSVLLEGQSSKKFNSTIASTVEKTGQGNSGGIELTARSLEIKDGADITVSTLNEGNGGLAKINVTESIVITGENVNGFGTGIFSRVNSAAKGNSGGIDITTGSLELRDGNAIAASTEGEGDAGLVKINATESILVTGESSQGTSSSIVSQIGPTAQGNSEGIDIKTGYLELRDGGEISASTFGTGNAGLVKVNATDSVLITREDSGGDVSNISSEVRFSAQGNSGGIELTTGYLELKDGSEISASTFGEGNAGLVKINATDSVLITGENSGGDKNSIVSRVQVAAQGNSGGIELTTGSLEVRVGQISASTFGTGNAGGVKIIATDSILLTGDSATGFTGGIFSQVGSEELSKFGLTAKGNSGGVELTTGSLEITDGSQILTSTRGEGNAGKLKITVNDNISLSNGAIIGTSTLEKGQAAGNITITANRFSATNGSQLTSSTENSFDAGSINLFVTEDITLAGENTGLLANTSPGSSGNSGDIFIDPITMTIRDGAFVAVNSQGSGLGGNITLFAGDLNLFNQGMITAATANTSGGNITLNVPGLVLMRNNSLISAAAGGAGDGGNITLNVGFIVAVPTENSDVIARASQGLGGNIIINADGVYGFVGDSRSLTLFSDLNASSDVVGNEGNVAVNVQFDATQGLNELPASLVDAESLVDKNACKIEGDKIAGGSSFRVTGRGGLPANPLENLTNSHSLIEWASSESDAKSTASTTITEQKEMPYQQAQGWLISTDDKVTLTTAAKEFAHQQAGMQHPSCQDVSPE